jgi:hypothetical protein
MSISESSRVRALFLLDRLAMAVKAANGFFDFETIRRDKPLDRHARKSEDNRGGFQIHDTRYFVRITAFLVDRMSYRWLCS